MIDIKLNLLKEKIEQQKWADAFKDALTLVSAYSNIEYGKSLGDGDGKKYRNWLQTYSIDKYDKLKKNYTELGNFFVNENDEISKRFLNSKFLNKKLKFILYKARCSSSHEGTTQLDILNDNGENIMLKLFVSEHNIISIKANEISICPHFFSKLVLYSIDEYKKSILNKSEEIKDRFHNYLGNSDTIVGVSVDLGAVKFKSNVNLDIATLLCVKDNNSITLEEEHFSFVHRENTIVVRYNQVKAPISEVDGKFTIDFSEKIQNSLGVIIDNKDGLANELMKKINSYNS